MKAVRTLTLLFCVLSSLGSSSAYALRLIDAYRLAVGADSTYLAARAENDATRELVPQALGGFLPSVGISMAYSRATTEATIPTLSAPRTSDTDYLSKNASLTFRQPLLRLDRVANYFSASAQVDSAEANLVNARQKLALRVSGAYFDVLIALENAEYMAAQKAAYTGQLARAQRAFKSGTGTRIDIDEAQARLEMAIAREVDATNQVSQAERTLSTLISRKVSAANLERLVTERLPLQSEQLGSVSEWQSSAEANSPQLQAAIKAAEAARFEINRARAGHLPSVDLVASIGQSQSDTLTSIGQSYSTRQIGVQISIPLFSGGQTTSSDRQAVATHQKFQYQAEAVRSELLTNIGKEFDTVMQGAVKIRATEQALFAASRARSSTEKGVLAGTRNNIDVLNAQQQELSAQIEALRSRYEFVAAWLRLNALAGSLNDGQLETASHWLADGESHSRRRDSTGESAP